MAVQSSAVVTFKFVTQSVRVVMISEGHLARLRQTKGTQLLPGRRGESEKQQSLSLRD